MNLVNGYAGAQAVGAAAFNEVPESKTSLHRLVQAADRKLKMTAPSRKSKRRIQRRCRMVFDVVGIDVEEGLVEIADRRSAAYECTFVPGVQANLEAVGIVGGVGTGRGAQVGAGIEADLVAILHGHYG